MIATSNYIVLWRIYEGRGYFHSKAFVPIDDPVRTMVQRMLELRLFDADRSTACNFSAWNPHRSCSPACERFINRKLYENPNRPLFKRADGTNDAFSMLSWKQWHNSNLSPPPPFFYSFYFLASSLKQVYFLHLALFFFFHGKVARQVNAEIART